jgi:hypothetical protein
MENIAVPGSAFVGILSYWLALFLIRGMRAVPEYAIEPEEPTAPDAIPASPAASSR